MERYLILILALISFNNLLNAQDLYEEYKVNYDRLRKEEKHDSALVFAKQMNTWALQNETDTSLRYAVSLRYVGNCFNSLNNVDSAKYFFDFSLSTLRIQGREKSINAIRCIHNIGVIYYNLKDYEKTDSLWTIVLGLNRLLDDKSDDFRDALNNLVALNNDRGNYDQSKKYMLELLESTKLKYGGMSIEYANRSNELGIIFSDMANYKDAETYYKEALDIREKKLGIDHQDFANSLNNLGLLYKAKGDFKSAEILLIQSLEIRKKLFSEEHPDYASSLNNLGILYSDLGNYKTAEAYYKQSIEIRNKLLGESHPDYAGSLNNLGNLYMNIGNFKDALIYCQKALKSYEKSLGKEHPDYLSCLTSIGSLYYKLGDFKLAELYFKQKLDNRSEVLDLKNPSNGSILEGIGLIYYASGDYESAESYYKKSLDIYKTCLGEYHYTYGGNILNLGLLYKEMGDFKTAEMFYKQAIDIYKKTYGEDHPDYASSINNLGGVYLDIGDYKTAEPFYKHAIEIYKKTFGEEHPDYAMSLNNLGILFYYIGDFKAAEQYYKQALEIRKKSLGEVHHDYAASLVSLGALYSVMGDYKSSEPYFKQSLEIYKKTYGEEHPNYAMSLNNLGTLYENLGNYSDAESYYEQALDIKRKTLGVEHPSYVSNETNYAYLLMKTDREQQAYDILSKNLKKKAIEIADNFEWLNDNQKEAYWKKESSFYDNLSWFANETSEKVPEAVRLNYNAALITKSKMLEAKISSENYYREVDELREELAYRRRFLAKMESDGSSEKEKLEKLRKESDSLDKRLTLSWPEYAQQKKNLSITWDQVQQNLDKGEAALEFVRFENGEDSLVYYNALVLKKGDQNPSLVKLCKEKELQSITPKIGYSAYYPLVWQPLEATLKDVKTIYYAPTGELYNVPFHAIYAPKGKGDEVLAAKTDKRGVVIQNERAATEQDAEYLMDRYSIHQLTSTRYLAMGIKQKAKEPIGNTMAMVGGVNYDYLPGSTAAPKKKKKDKNASRSSASTSGKLNYLEGTKTEVEQINKQVTTSSWQTKLIQNNDAIEENITKLEGKEAKGILHLATHGYAFPEYDFKDTSINKNSLRYSYRYSTNPMVRSGLILAGGNWAWTGNDTLSKLGAEQNGILTALEVSQLNLKKTKLVVLSACETGLGKIEGSEGTFGLKRGFKLAGVEQMIVSLWSIPDKETMELMTLFYSDLTLTLNPVISFEKAQKEMRNKYPTEPEKWAGFILVR